MLQGVSQWDELAKCDEQFWKSSYRARVMRDSHGGIEITATAIRHEMEAKLVRRPRGRGQRVGVAAREAAVAVAVRRARRMIRWLIGENSLDHMLTLTYRENVSDLQRVKRDWDRFRRFVRVKYPNWNYVVVPEVQERGAWHLHVAVKGRQDLNWLRKCWYRALGARVWVSGADTPGQIDVRAPWKRWGGGGYTWAVAKLAGYLGKYIAKSFEENERFNARRYWPAKELSKPEVIRFYLDAVTPNEVVQECCEIVNRLEGSGWSMYMSRDKRAFWISASGRPPEPCPF